MKFPSRRCDTKHLNHREIGDVEIDFSVIVIIADRQTHACLLAAVFVQRDAGRITGLFESAVPFIDVKLLGRRIIDDD